MGRWSKQGCINSAREYDHLKTWIRERKTAYLAARDNGWLEECFSHMSKRNDKKWSFEKCLASARNYASRCDWQRGDIGAYNAAIIHGWFDRCADHMPRNRNLSEVWTLDKCKEIAKKFKTRDEWYHEETNSFKEAKKRGWLDGCCQHMGEIEHYVTKQDCINSAKPYSTVDEFFKQENFYFKIAKENGWLPKIKDIYYERNARSWIEKNMGGFDG